MTMANVMEATRSNSSSGTLPIPRVMRRKVEELLEGNYAFMDSPIFAQKNIEKELFDFDKEPQLPMTSWYQPTRDEAVDEAISGCAQLMKAAGRADHVPSVQLSRRCDCAVFRS